MVPIILNSNSNSNSTPPADDQILYFHYPHYGNQGGTPGAAIRQGDFKLIEFFTDGHTELYNLREDLSEQNDLSSRYPEKREELLHLLHQWQSNVGARMPVKNPLVHFSDSLLVK